MDLLICSIVLVTFSVLTHVDIFTPGSSAVLWLWHLHSNQIQQFKVTDSPHSLWMKRQRQIDIWIICLCRPPLNTHLALCGWRGKFKGQDFPPEKIQVLPDFVNRLLPFSFRFGKRWKPGKATSRFWDYAGPGSATTYPHLHNWGQLGGSVLLGGRRKAFCFHPSPHQEGRREWWGVEGWLRQCHRLSICFLSDLTNSTISTVRRAGLSRLACWGATVLFWTDFEGGGTAGLG